MDLVASAFFLSSLTPSFPFLLFSATFFLPRGDSKTATRGRGSGSGSGLGLGVWMSRFLFFHLFLQLYANRFLLVEKVSVGLQRKILLNKL